MHTDICLYMHIHISKKKKNRNVILVNYEKGFPQKEKTSIKYQDCFVGELTTIA